MVFNRHNRANVFQSDAHVEDRQGHQVLGSLSGTRKLILTLWNPAAVQADDNEVCIWKAVDAAITVTKLEITLDSAANEVAGDLKYADTFIGLANPVVINAFDTTSGVLVDESITSGAVASGKCLYLSFDSAPDDAITQMNVGITFSYD